MLPAAAHLGANDGQLLGNGGDGNVLYIVEGAGSGRVNGNYFRRAQDLYGAPSYQNQAGVLLFRYFGNSWYLSDADSDLTKSAGDYYRVSCREDEDAPCQDGWILCVEGVAPVPRVRAARAPCFQALERVRRCWRGAARAGELGCWAALRGLARPLRECCPLRSQTGGRLLGARGGYIVEGASLQKVNGSYTRRLRYMDGVPCYQNKAGILLFRYVLRSGRRFWYLSEGSGDLTKSAGDYYRVCSDDSTPPETGWEGTHNNFFAAAPTVMEASAYGRPKRARTMEHGQAAAGTSSPSGSSGETAPVLPGPAAEAAAEAESSAGAEVADKEAPSQELAVLLLSGLTLALLPVAPSWTGADVKFALDAFVQEGSYVTTLVAADRIFEDAQTVADMGLLDGAQVQALVKAYDYLVEGAGAAAVNGRYVRKGEKMNGADSYTNEHGTLLFAYVFSGTGTRYWYFSDPHVNFMREPSGDYYRVRSDSKAPPLEGWTAQKCPRGKGALPTLRRPACAPAEADAEEAESDETGSTSSSSDALPNDL